MATDFTACGFGAITPELILRTLIGCIGNTKYIRVAITTPEVTTPIHCGNYEDVQINLQRCLVIATVDDKITLRVNVQSDNPTPISECDVCGAAVTVPEILNNLFSEDSEGRVYLNLFNTIT